MRFYVIILFLLLYTNTFAQFNQSIQPLQYPHNVVTQPQPYFIWCDIYNTQSKPFIVRLILSDSKGQSHEFTLYPEVIDSLYCVVQIPIALTPDTYTYSIQLIAGNKPVDKRYYHHKKYPVEGSFTIDLTSKNSVDALDKSVLMYYLAQSRNNTLHNGYNALFFTSSGSISLATGIVVYYMTNLGVITTIITAVTVTSGVVGISAGIYYCIKYYQTKHEIQSVIDK